MSSSSTLGHFSIFFSEEDRGGVRSKQGETRRSLCSSPLLSLRTDSRAAKNPRGRLLFAGHIVEIVVDVASVFFYSPQTVTRSVTFLQLHIRLHTLLPPRTDSVTVKKIKRRGGCCLRVIFLHVSSTPRQFSFFSFYSNATEGFVAYFQKTRNSTFVSAP